MNCPLDSPILEFIQSQPPESQPALLNLLEQKEDEAARRTIPNKGAEPCLAALKEKGMPMGILTRNSLKSLNTGMGNFQGIELADFSAVITRDDSRPKPHPEGIQRAAGQMGMAPRELLMVGDFRFDVMAGKAAGARTVLLTNGGESIMAPEDPEPDHVVRDLVEILFLLQID
jgi:HAD superfamily hydrolase (TIGR01509 family)